MRGLRDLELHLEYEIDYYGAEVAHSFDRVTREGMLRPLLDVWGLDRLGLRYGVVSNGDICSEPQENSFRQELQEAVMRPRSLT